MDGREGKVKSVGQYLDEILQSCKRAERVGFKIFRIQLSSNLFEKLRGRLQVEYSRVDYFEKYYLFKYQVQIMEHYELGEKYRLVVEHG